MKDIDSKQNSGENRQIDLSLIWVGIIGLGVLIYVVMDGFDLGIGIMFPIH